MAGVKDLKRYALAAWAFLKAAFLAVLVRLGLVVAALAAVLAVLVLAAIWVPVLLLAVEVIPGGGMTTDAKR